MVHVASPALLRFFSWILEGVQRIRRPWLLVGAPKLLEPASSGLTHPRANAPNFKICTSPRLPLILWQGFALESLHRKIGSTIEQMAECAALSDCLGAGLFRTVVGFVLKELLLLLQGPLWYCKHRA